jgi:hypothetical protein
LQNQSRVYRVGDATVTRVFEKQIGGVDPQSVLLGRNDQIVAEHADRIPSDAWNKPGEVRRRAKVPMSKHSSQKGSRHEGFNSLTQIRAEHTVCGASGVEMRSDRLITRIADLATWPINERQGALTEFYNLVYHPDRVDDCIATEYMDWTIPELRQLYEAARKAWPTLLPQRRG